MATLTEDLKELREIRNMRDDAKDEYDELKDKYESKQADVIERMKEEGVDSQKTDGITFSPQSTVYGQVTDRAEFVKWAEENDPELVEKKERKALINQLIRQKLDDGETPPPGLGFYVKEFIGQRAS